MSPGAEGQGIIPPSFSGSGWRVGLLLLLSRS